MSGLTHVMAPIQERFKCSKFHRFLFVSFSSQNDFQHFLDLNHRHGGLDRLVLEFFSSGTGVFTTLVVLRLSK